MLVFFPMEGFYFEATLSGNLWLAQQPILASTEALSEISAKSCFLISRVNSLDARFDKTQPYDDFFWGIFVRGIQRFPFIAPLCGVALMLKFSFIIFICTSFFCLKRNDFIIPFLNITHCLYTNVLISFQLDQVVLVGQEVLELRELRVVRDPRLVPFFLQVREVPLALLIPPTRIFGVLL